MKAQEQPPPRLQRRNDPGFIHQLTLKYVRRTPRWRFWERSIPFDRHWLTGPEQKPVAD